MEKDWRVRNGMWQCQQAHVRGMVSPGRWEGEWIAWIVGEAGLRPAGTGFASRKEAKAWVEQELGLAEAAGIYPEDGDDIERRHYDRRQVKRRYLDAPWTPMRRHPVIIHDRRTYIRRHDDDWLAGVVPNPADRRHHQH